MGFAGYVTGSCCLLLLLLGSCEGLNISCQRLSSEPLISSLLNNSDFLWNYNAAYMPNGLDALLVRVQNMPTNATSPYQTTPSKLAYVSLADKVNVSQQSIVFQPDSPADNYGTEDPRVFYWPQQQLYLLTYTAAEQYQNGSVVARLALAMSQDGRQWKELGAMLNQTLVHPLPCCASPSPSTLELIVVIYLRFRTAKAAPWCSSATAASP